ncbi:hypothetical protein DY023_15225 [Microbacterium bovistercoris]|uniref:Uncharacterized protein n=1 Tax=Microbacterium bovistercoris TaxID=2293570 RepID=A0A371NPZ2_9MICO|nr:hypothetical protein [Microbacterium bovistercoris]REJ04253.1 hypothetical protein DY023_15225 [Microbacterium bovistercoris]
MNDTSREDEDAPLSPEQMLALLQDQQRTVSGRMGAFVPWILVAWGVAWFAGFLILWWDVQQHPATVQPTLAAGIAFAALLVLAGIVSMVLGIGSGRGLRGTRDSAIVGIVYGNSWWVGSLAIVVIGQALVQQGMDRDLLGVFFPSAFSFFAGVMYIMSGLLWRAYPMVVLGLWSVALAAIGSLLPPPVNYLVFAIAGGGAFLLIAGWTAWWVHVARRRVAAAEADRA